MSSDLDRRVADPELHDDAVIPESLDLLGAADRCWSRPSAATSSLRNKNGAFGQTKTSRTQRPYPRPHFDRRPSISPLDSRMTPRKEPAWRFTQRLRESTTARSTATTIRLTPRMASSVLSL